jgi:hypothetical protein
VNLKRAGRILKRMNTIREAIEAVWLRLGMYSALAYTGALSLVGIEALLVIFDFSSAWPAMFPVVILVLAVIYALREARGRRPGRSDPGQYGTVQHAPRHGTGSAR